MTFKATSPKSAACWRRWNESPRWPPSAALQAQGYVAKAQTRLQSDVQLMADGCWLIAQTKGPAFGGPFRLMEARGIEPRSETRSTTASTCVAYQLRSPGAGRQATHSWTSSLEFRPALESATRGYPEFAIPMKPPRAGFPMGRCNNAMRYAARAKLLLAVVIFPSVLPGTRVPGHAATASLTPSKPVAPVGS